MKKRNEIIKGIKYIQQNLNFLILIKCWELLNNIKRQRKMYEKIKKNICIYTRDLKSCCLQVWVVVRNV